MMHSRLTDSLTHLISTVLPYTLALMLVISLVGMPAVAMADDNIGTLQTTVDNNPDDFDTWFQLGVLQARKQLFKNAIYSFQQVVRLQPNLAEPHNNLAVLYNESGDLKAAVQELETSLRLNPAYTTAYENIADLYVKLAANAYKKALQQEDKDETRQRYMRLLHVRDGLTETGLSVKQPDKKIVPTEQRQSASAVLAAVEAWRKAWSEQNLQGYFTAYADDYNPGSQYTSLDAWKQYKQRVIGKKRYIRVRLEQIATHNEAGGAIRVTFLQHFRSDSFNQDEKKVLLMTFTPDGWKITREASR